MIPDNKILILDGAMGTMIQRYGLPEAEFKGNNEYLNIIHPEIIYQIHKEYIAAGADIIETNTFSANEIPQIEYGCEAKAYEMALAGARIARKAADDAMKLFEAQRLERKIFVAGSIGPTSKSLSLSPDASDASFRPYSFTAMKKAYKSQASALIEGGADLLLLETCFDALNAKAALCAIEELNIETGRLATDEKIPVIISVSVGDRSGRTLTGQTLKAFYASVRHYPLTAFGLNCSLGAEELMPLMQDIAQWCRCRTICYPNAGLPNEMGGYDQKPYQMAKAVRKIADKGLIDIAGGCCGTTPEHIKAIAEALEGVQTRCNTISEPEDNSFAPGTLTVSGLEAVTIDTGKYNFTNIGERTNVAGSRKFARLISEHNYDEALRIAAGQIEGGASVIDINMDDAMLESDTEMMKFVRCVANDPNVAKAALMIDSSHWETILAGLSNAQGKCIVNSLSLKEGEEAFISKAVTVKAFGASVVVMAFDEQGQATDFERKTSICERAYRILTDKVGFAPEDIIFDANILAIGTGIKEHASYGIDFLKAVSWIKANLPGAKTSGGVSNLSFAFRGNNPVREAMHSAFLYHGIRAGLDMAIVNPSMLQPYDEIEKELLSCVEDVIFDRNETATERLIAKASAISSEKQSMATTSSNDSHNRTDIPIDERIIESLKTGKAAHLKEDLEEAVQVYGKAVDIIEGPLMKGMEIVGEMFGQGKMFLPQVVKSAKVMRDAVNILEPYMNGDDDKVRQDRKPVAVIATVKGDVHDIGKNITAIVLTCNGFNVHDLGVMVDKETILNEAERLKADIIAVSGLITPSLFQMEEICREMKEREMTTPLFIGGATTSALHTAVKLAPLYEHTFYGADASACAVMAKKCIIDRKSFENEQHKEQQKIKRLYEMGKNSQESYKMVSAPIFATDSYISFIPEDVETRIINSDCIMEYFDWKMFYAIWGVKYGKQVPEAAELIQLRRDAEDILAFRNFKIKAGIKFTGAFRRADDIILPEIGKTLPMFRQESGKLLSLSDYVIPEESGKTSLFGAFAISVSPVNAHQDGCSCPACSCNYENMLERAVRSTLAEAVSIWIDRNVIGSYKELEDKKIIKPAAGYSSCPDHSLKRDLLEMIPKNEELGISLTESYAMMPESSICGMIFIHPQATYPEIRSISSEQYENYLKRRNISETEGRRLLGHLLK